MDIWTKNCKTIHKLSETQAGRVGKSENQTRVVTSDAPGLRSETSPECPRVLKSLRLRSKTKVTKENFTRWQIRTNRKRLKEFRNGHRVKFSSESTFWNVPLIYKVPPERRMRGVMARF